MAKRPTKSAKTSKTKALKKWPNKNTCVFSILLALPLSIKDDKTCSPCNTHWDGWCERPPQQSNLQALNGQESWMRERKSKFIFFNGILKMDGFFVHGMKIWMVFNRVEKTHLQLVFVTFTGKCIKPLCRKAEMFKTGVKSASWKSSL